MNILENTIITKVISELVLEGAMKASWWRECPDSIRSKLIQGVQEIINPKQESDHLIETSLTCFWKNKEGILFQKIFPCVYDTQQKAIISIDPEYIVKVLVQKYEITREYIIISTENDIRYIQDQDLIWALEDLC